MGDCQEIRGDEGRATDQAAVDIGLTEQLGGVARLHTAAVQDRQGIGDCSIVRRNQ